MCGFQAAFGRRAETAWFAPGRVNLIGEHTDYSDGFVLPLALPSGVVAAVARRDDDAVRVRSRQRPEAPEPITPGALHPGGVPGWAGYPAGVVWQLRRAGHPVGGVDVLLDGRLPSGAGLASSAAVTCAVATALDELFALRLPRRTLAAHARGAEVEFVGMPCGVMDQYAALLCADGHALFLDTRSSAVAQVPLDLAASDTALLLVDTGARHALVDGRYADRRRDCEEAAALLGVDALRDVDADELEASLRRLGRPVLRRRVRHVVTENVRVLRTVELLRAGRPRGIGPLLTASHASLRDDFEVSCREQDVAVAAALDAGALGARLTGGGFGGCVVVLVELDRAETVLDRITAAFAGHGFARPTRLPLAPSPGAAPHDG